MTIGEILRSLPDWRKRAEAYVEHHARCKDDPASVAREEWGRAAERDILNAKPGDLLWRPFLLLFDLTATPEELEGTAEIIRQQTTEAAAYYSRYIEYYREVMARWPKPQQFLEKQGIEAYPLLREIVKQNAAAARAFIAGAYFCEDFRKTARLVESILKERMGGRIEVIVKQYECDDRIGEKLAMFTQLQISSLRNLIFPGMRGGSLGLIRDHQSGQYYTKITYSWSSDVTRTKLTTTS